MTPDSADTPPPLSIEWSGMTHPGKWRQNNEDSFLAVTYDTREVRFLGKVGQSSMEQGDFVFAVSDGMGGANAGEFASRTAVDKITRLMPRTYRMAAGGLAAGIGDVMVEVFSHVHSELNKLGAIYAECRGMGATLSMACFTPGWMHFAHVGDSRIYYLPRGGAMRQLTDDHSHVGWLRRNGKINEREARTHPRKSMLDQSLGGGHTNVEPQLGSVGVQPGDRFLLCSDGIVDGMWDDRIAEYLALSAMDATTHARRFVEKAVDESGRDNCTALVVEIGGE
jgi:serine/threonine protein phosphatase PrpC